MSLRNNISVVINTYNAEKYLAKVLETAKSFDEVVVCDMESTDSTFAIQSASSDWVLVADADELIPQALHDYLYEFVSNPGDVRGLYIPRKNYTMGVFLPSSYPDYQLRFFVKEGTEWPPYVHTFPVVQGKLEHIPESRKDLAFDHLDDSTRATIVRLNNYTDNEVEKRAGKHVTLFSMVFSPMMRFASA